MVWPQSGDLAKVVAVIEDNAQPRTQCLCIPAERCDLIDIKVAIW
jgi:hypothetical protein